MSTTNSANSTTNHNQNSTSNPFGYIKDDNVYLKGYNDKADRKIGVVKESPEASIAYFEDRYQKLLEKVEEVANDIEESQNKGSYLMKLIHIRESLETYNAIGDYTAVEKRILELEQGIEDYISENRVKNTEIKTALLAEAQELKDSDDWEEVSEYLKDLKMRWIRTGSVGEEDEEMSEEFDRCLDVFFERRKAFFDNERIVNDERILKYKRISNKVRKLNYHKEKTPEIRQEVIDLQKAWKEVGVIPKWKYLKLYRNYKREIDIFFGNPEQSNDSYNSYRQEPPVPTTPEGILESKRKLTEEVEEIASKFENVHLNSVKTKQVQWKKMGIIRNNDEDRLLNNRFHAACSEIFTHVFLENDAKQNFEGYEEKTGFEQLKLKIKLIKDSIREEEPKLQQIAKDIPQDSYGRPMFDRNDPSHAPVRSQYMNLLNVIRTKKRLSKKFQNQLNSSYNF
ncbi:DUF349 domain-containing protein [Bernardetia sp. ABR2-2B]|uniref:DUF349 domain-containing protein n=1 Tax=Bernardetia sp. ABR2-2B TaxID=3127472 RepID=UPI0030D3EFFD